MSADRKMTEQRVVEKPGSVERPRTSVPSAAGASPTRVGFSREETPSVRLKDQASGAGAGPGPGTPTPATSSGGPGTPPVGATQVPAFTVAGSVVGIHGANAVLTPEATTLAVDSAKFTWDARVAAPSGPQVAKWDVGFIQNITWHSLLSRYRHTDQRYLVSVPIRDTWKSTTAPWYDDSSFRPVDPGKTVPVAMSDIPWHRLTWNDPRTGEANALVRTTRILRLKAWLAVRNRVSQAIVYLKNVAWGLDFDVNVKGHTATNAGAGMVNPAIGDGQGGLTPKLSGQVYNDVFNGSSNPVNTATGAAPARPARPSAPATVRPPAPVRTPAPVRATVAAPVSTSTAAPAVTTAVTLAPTVAPAARGVLTPEIAKLVSGAGGEPLPADVLAQLETAMDVPLGLVRVHTDARTRAVVDGTGSRAFTYGLHIYLGSQASPTDIALMAHEVTHVIQQQGRPVLQMYTPPATGDAFEHEAHSVSSAVQQGQRATVSRRTGGARVQGFWPVSQIVDWIEDRAWGLVNRFAPDLVPIIRQGPLEWLKEKISNAVDSIVNTLMAPVRAITGLASSLRGHFANLLAWLRDAAAKIARGDCSSLTEAAHKIHDVFMGIASPIIDRIKGLATRVSNFFGGLWDRFGAPVWNFLRRIGGAVWERIQSFGRWIWDVTAPIRRVLMRAWRWIKNKLGIGEGPEGQNGILQWVQRKAQSAWDNYILPFIERFKRPLMVVGGILLMLSPAGPIIAIGAIAYGVIRGVQAIRQYFGTRGGIVNGRNILQNEIIPGIVNTINRVAAFLREKAQFLAGKLNSIVGGLGNAAGAVAGTIISFIARGLTWLAERFGELVNWVMDHVMSFVNWVAGVLQRLVTFLRPVLDFLRRVAAVVRNIMRLSYEFGARIWNAIPACIRDPFIDFFIPLILRQIPFFSELGATPEAWQQTRASIMLLVRQIFRDFDLWGAMRTAFGIVVRALRIPVDLIRQLIDKASRAWNAVLAAPIRFIRSALQAILRGMGRFMGNFLSHLWYGVQGWLFNAVSDRGITPPSSWTDFRAVFGFVLDVLGISLDHVLDLLATRIGRPAVARIRTVINVLTGVWEWVSVAIREGPAGIWRMIVERLRDLGTMVLETAVRWVMTRIIAIVGARITAMAATAGLSAVLEAVVAIYQAIQTAIEYARRILQVLITIFDTVLQIAQGVIDPAAGMVEAGLRMIMPVVIGFLANYAGLGGIGERIREIIDGVRERVDTAILWLIDRALAAGRWILDRLRAGAAAVAGWLGIRKTFTANDGQRHSVYFQGSEDDPQIMMATTPDTVQAHIDARRANTAVPLTRAQATSLNAAEATLLAIRQLTRPSGRARPETETIRPQIDRLLTTLTGQLTAGGIVVNVPLSNVTYTTAGPMKAGTVRADPLTSRAGNTTGSGTGSSNPPGWVSVTSGAIANPSSYVRMHLLYHLLHGPGVAWNLVPAPQSYNIGFMQPNIEIPLKDATDSGATFRFSVSVGYPSTGGPIDNFPDTLTATWTPIVSPPGVTIPTAPTARPIPPPTFVGPGTVVAPDLSVLSFTDLQRQIGLPQDLCRAIVRARGGSTFSGPADFKQKVDAALRSIYTPARTYLDYQPQLLAKRTQFVLNGTRPSARDLRWP
ncbi:MAG: eCIS core domain-containing protein [Candidatus Angelobacter sp.]